MNNIKVKIGLFGDTNVGKTSIFNIINNNISNTDTHTTIGVDFIIKNYKINNTNIKLHIWDTAGQERYNAIIKPYYSVDIPIFVFNMNDKGSFDNLHKWIADTNEYNKFNTIARYLIGNKSDLECVVPYADINEFIISHNLKYYVNSNLIQVNIVQIMENIVNNIYKLYAHKYPKTNDHIINIKRPTRDVFNNRSGANTLGNSIDRCC